MELLPLGVWIWQQYYPPMYKINATSLESAPQHEAVPFMSLPLGTKPLEITRILLKRCCKHVLPAIHSLYYELQRDPSLPILSWILKLEPAWTDFPLYVLEPFLLVVISPFPGGRGSKSWGDLWPSLSWWQPDTLKPLWSRKHGRVIYRVL